MPENLLCFGDNANFLRDKDLFPDESVDLIYLDPPFNSQRPYNILFKDHKGTASAAQIKAFDDTWKWGEVAQRNSQRLIRTRRHLRGLPLESGRRSVYNQVGSIPVELCDAQQ